jgi:hypothetical protein
MSEFKGEDFKFPDENAVEQKDDDKFEIEIEDDTPEEDRGRTKIPSEIVEKLDKDELAQYDEEVQQKMLQMRKVWHDERREKEQALREQQEAINFAKRVAEENKRIKQMLSNGEKEYVDSIKTTAEMSLEMAKKAYKEAHEMGDVDQMLDAQQKLQEANLRLMQAKNFKPTALQEEHFDVQTQPEQIQSVPKPDERAVAWQKQNSWFGSDEEMTAAALGLHEKLKRNGVKIGSDEYYATLDKTMRKRFPEEFGGTQEEEVVSKAEAPERHKPRSVVAPAVRSTASNKVKLTTSAVQLAKKLGLTPEQYAIEMKKLEAQNV